MSRRDQLALREYLAHIQQATRRIQRYMLNVDRAGFLENEEKKGARSGPVI
jgi:hypothetical protein